MQNKVSKKNFLNKKVNFKITKQNAQNTCNPQATLSTAATNTDCLPLQSHSHLYWWPAPLPHGEGQTHIQHFTHVHLNIQSLKETYWHDVLINKSTLMLLSHSH